MTSDVFNGDTWGGPKLEAGEDRPSHDLRQLPFDSEFPEFRRKLRLQSLTAVTLVRFIFDLGRAVETVNQTVREVTVEMLGLTEDLLHLALFGRDVRGFVR